MCQQTTGTDEKNLVMRQASFIDEVHDAIHENDLTHDEAAEAVKGSGLFDTDTDTDSEILGIYMYSGFEFRVPQKGETVLLICSDGPHFERADNFIVSRGTKFLVRAEGSYGYTAPYDEATA